MIPNAAASAVVRSTDVSTAAAADHGAACSAISAAIAGVASDGSFSVALRCRIRAAATAAGASQRSSTRSARAPQATARGRLYLPVWLQRGDAVLVGTTMDPLLVVIAPVGVLDGIGDVLVGEQQ
jgi:hypothetical protein